MCSSVKAVRPTFRSLSLAESSKRQAQRGTGFQLLNFQDLSKRLTSSHIVLQRFEANFQPVFGTLNYRTTDFKLGFKGA